MSRDGWKAMGDSPVSGASVKQIRDFKLDSDSAECESVSVKFNPDLS